jgi:hypothetical protein
MTDKDYYWWRRKIATYMFNKGINGHRLTPPLDAGYNHMQLAALTSLFGPHNSDATFIENQEGLYEGVKLVCQCAACVRSQAKLVVDTQRSMIGLGAMSISLYPNKENRSVVDFVERTDCEMETRVKAQREAERRQLAENLTKVVGAFQSLELRVNQLEREMREGQRLVNLLEHELRQGQPRWSLKTGH